MSEWVEVKKDEEEKKEQATIWSPSAMGESIQGIYIDMEENVGQYKSNMYTLKGEKGEVKLWGSTVLDNLMEKVPFGHEVRVTYNGTQPSKNGKNPWKDYKVEYRSV
ncbi:hypothetical protein [Methanobacterium alcaliphilum]|uniref:hypothetical protein n=1 Tax=Methanobacterium alcaliphilum TaxID=392018 RepID=UPI00200B39A8|nr:hypothetical protein [Methanobacterium alcaliphilum]MCK9151845.1 hypothetical protein [Methanobacterium alcaliphilum]